MTKKVTIWIGNREEVDLEEGPGNDRQPRYKKVRTAWESNAVEERLKVKCQVANCCVMTCEPNNHLESNHTV